MYLIAALMVFLIVGMWCQHRELKDWRNRFDGRLNNYYKRLKIHSEYMGLLSYRQVAEEEQEMYPEWLAMEEKVLEERRHKNRVASLHKILEDHKAENEQKTT